MLLPATLIAGLAHAGPIQPAPLQRSNAAPQVIVPSAALTLDPIRTAAAPPPRGGFAPAPMPDIDAAAPVTVTADAPNVAPAFYGQKRHVDGNAFGNGANDHQRPVYAAAGLALAVPLN